MRVALQHADHGALVWTHLQRVRDAMQAGDVARAIADLDRARPVANATRRSFSRWMLLLAEAAYAAFDGRLDEADRMTEEALVLNQRHSDDCFHEHTVGRLVLARLRWRPQDADAAQLRGFAARYPHLPAWEAMLASLEWELGNVEAARRGVALCARDDFAAVTRSPDFLAAAVCLAEAAAGAGEPWQVERLYELLLRTRAPTRCSSTCGRSGGRRRGRSGCSPPPTTARRTPPRTSPRAVRLAQAWGSPGWELRSIGDWLATGVPVGERAEIVGRGLALARELALPGVAARIADEAQTITP